MYQAVTSAYERLTGALYWVAMLAMLAMSLHVFASVAFRTFLGRDLAGTLETTAFYYMPLLAFAALPHLDKFGGHIRADLITGMVSPKTSAVLEAATRLAMAAFFALIAWFSVDVAMDRMQSQEVARSANGFMAIWPGRWVLAVAAVLASFHYILGFIGIVLGVVEPEYHPEEVADAVEAGHE